MSLANQVIQFLLELGSGQPWGRLPVEVMLGDMTRVKAEFRLFLENNGRVVVASAACWRRLSDTAIEVNLDAPLRLPFDGAVPEWQPPAGRGWVKVERIGEEVFVGGRKVILHLEPEQLTGVLQGHTLRERLQTKGNLDLRIFDALAEFENGRLIPESWKQYSRDRIRYLFAWAVGFRDSGSRLCVRYMYCDCDNGQWQRCYIWTDCEWGVQYPALILES